MCAGGNTDLYNKVLWYVLFVRTEKANISGKSSDKRNVKWYGEEIILPFVAECRVTLYGIKPIEPALDKLAVMCWSDWANGANAQLAVILDGK